MEKVACNLSTPRASFYVPTWLVENIGFIGIPTMIGCASVRIANHFVLQKIERVPFWKKKDCDVATNVNYVVGS